MRCFWTSTVRCSTCTLSAANALKEPKTSISQAFKRMLDGKKCRPDKHQETTLAHFDRLAHELAVSDLLNTDGLLPLIQRRLRLKVRKNPTGIYQIESGT